MRYLETRPSTRVVAAITVAALVATVAVWSLFTEPEREMSARGYGIVDYELAFTAERANDILHAWGAEAEPAARRSLLVDFAFMPSYGLLFAGITLLIARLQGGKLRRAGLALTPLALVAALCDALENLMLLSMLGAAGRVAVAPPLVAGVAATIKFALLAVLIVYWLAAGVAWAAQRLRGAGMA